jgi:DNA-binding transcriptional regulator GbsR (MarR family)
MAITPSMNEFILHWGEMGTRWGINRTVAQVHALLYLSEEPLTAEEIADTLAVARSNVSTSLRELQNWQLVHAVPRLGDRRDRFHTTHDVWQLFLTVLDQRVEREILPTLAVLERCAAGARAERPQNSGVTQRILAMQAFLEEGHSWYRTMRALPVVTLRALMHIGPGITRLLPGKKRKVA